jgi:hypothetical protein
VNSTFLVRLYQSASRCPWKGTEHRRATPSIYVTLARFF